MLNRKNKKKSPRRPRGRPRLEDVVALEKTLLSIALDEFQRHGYGGASMNAIARGAHVSKTTLYSRFPSKESLFRAIVQEQIHRVALEHALRPESHLDLAAGLEAFANYTLDLSLKGSLLQINRLIYSESHRFPELGVAAADRSKIGIARIANFIKDCADADGIPCKDPQCVAEAFTFMLRGWYVEVMLENRRVSPAERKKWVRRAVHVLLSSRSQW
jgi:TetR/AcrR family transcriptional repressor of mexJK operon